MLFESRSISTALCADTEGVSFTAEFAGKTVADRTRINEQTRAMSFFIL